MKHPQCAADFERRRHDIGAGAVAERMTDGFVRRVEMLPGYDHRRFDCAFPPGDCHGQHGMQLDFSLIGPFGATRWAGWFLEMVPGRHVESGTVKPEFDHGVFYAFDLGHHWSWPTYEGEGQMECELLPGGFCYYDGSGLHAESLVAPFLARGPAAVWERLRTEYDRLAAPDLAPMVAG